MRRKLTAIALLLLFSCLTACAGTMKAETPPLIVPFEAQKAGTVFTKEFQVREHTVYAFSLMVKTKEGEGREESRKLMEMLGRFRISTGVSIPLRLKVSKINLSSEQVLYEKEIYEEESIGASRLGFDKLITDMPLRAGRYRVTAVILKDTPELHGNPIAFAIYPWPNFKLISP